MILFRLFKRVEFFYIIAIIMSICVFGQQITAQSDNMIKSAEEGAFIQDDDFIIIEVESAPAIDDWIEETGLEGFSGESYYTWTGDEYLKETGIGTLTYKVFVKKNGTYYFKLHNRHDCEDATLCNDVWLKVDDGKWVKTFSPNNLIWTWRVRQEIAPHTYQNAEFVLRKGLHTIQLSARSANFHLDKFVLYPFNMDESFWKDEGETKYVFYNEDSLPPPVPENVLIEKAEKDSIINITWDISRDKIQTAGYNIYINEEKHNKDIVTQNEYKFDMESFAAQYAIRIEAVDWIGNSIKTDEYIYQNETAKIFEIPGQRYSIYPNPCENLLNINFTKSLKKDIHMVIVDFTGRNLCNKVISKGQIQYQFDVSGLQNGMYIIHIQGVGIKRKSVFIKQ